MAGMSGFKHDCECINEDISGFKKSIENSTLSQDERLLVWDFYVTHNLAGGCEQQVSLKDYGWNAEKQKVISEIENNLMKIALVNKMCCIRSKTIKDTLGEMNLSGLHICIEHPRIVLMQKYSVTVDENENLKYAGGGESRINCLFRHIRNSFAHSNTYFFENGNVLLEDKDNSTITARILINKQTLINWITYIDKDKKYYSIPSEEDNNGNTNIR